MGKAPCHTNELLVRCRAGLGTGSTDLRDPSRVPAPPCPQHHVMRITP